jgi:hypothetical protein
MRVFIYLLSIFLIFGCSEDPDPIIETEPDIVIENEVKGFLEGTCYITSFKVYAVYQVDGIDTTIVYRSDYKYDDQNRVVMRPVDAYRRDSIVYNQNRIDKIFRISHGELDHTYSFFYQGDTIQYYTKLFYRDSNNWSIYTDSFFYNQGRIVEVKESFIYRSLGHDFKETKWREKFLEYEDKNLVKVTAYQWTDNYGDPDIEQIRYWAYDEEYFQFLEARNPYYNSIFPDQFNESLLYNKYERYRKNGTLGIEAWADYDYGAEYSLNEYGYPDRHFEYFCVEQ